MSTNGIPNGVLLLTVALSLASCSDPMSETRPDEQTRTDVADAAYVNGKFYTVARHPVWADSVAIKDGKFMAVGTSAEIAKLIGAETKVTDLQGHMVIPGLHDAHTHLELVGKQWTYWCHIPDDASPEVFIETLQTCARSKGADEWLVASAYGPAMFPGQVVDRTYLDRFFPDRPVYIVEHSWHHGLANSLALQMAGIDPQTPDPYKGTIVRDQAGRPTGELVENATWLVTQHIPLASEADFRTAIEWSLAAHSRVGVTSVQDAATTEHLLRQLDALDDSGGLPMRVASHIVWQHSGMGNSSAADMESLIEQRAQYATRNVDTNFVKIIVDGSPMPPHSNHAELDPVTDEIPIERLLVEPDDLNEALIRFDAMGIKVKLHCVGTGAARAALDAIGAARAANGDSGIYHEVAHSVWYSPKDLPRVSALRAVSEMSPAIWHHGWPGMEEAFDFKQLNAHGGLITAGTDWVILPDPNLFPGLEGMMTREGLSIDLKSGIEILTINGAVSIGKQDEFGSIEVGKSADLAVLDRNLFEIPAEEIGETQVLMTVFRGEVVFRQEQLDN